MGHIHRKPQGVGSNPYPRRVKRMGIAYRRGQTGNWSFTYPSYDHNMSPFLPVVNPSPLVLPNGSILLAFRYDCNHCSFGETNALAIADTWQGPYRLLTANATPGLNCEDPFLFHRRGYHMIFHCYRDLNTGCHAYSEDGYTWHVSESRVYNTTLRFTNALYRRGSEPRVYSRPLLALQSQQECRVPSAHPLRWNV